jgi:assimilatory nitrate reductase electron transfer subunit
MAGARFTEDVRRRDEGVPLTVLGAEPRPAYNRVLLSTVLAGGLTPQAVELHARGWAERHHVDVRTGVCVTAIDRAARLVHCSDGSVVPYGELVLATGSRAFVPPLDGLDHPSVAAFRELGDCERILELATPGTRFAVLGGGLLGCEAARGLAGRGVETVVVHPRSHLMERQLDPDGGEVLAATLNRLGVEVLLDTTGVAWEPGKGLRCADGSLVEADALIVAAGVRPETSLAEAVGIAVDGGVLVDDRLTTNDPHVHAIGDCARHPAATPGLVQPAWEQAAVLADLLTGADPAARYRGTPTVTRLKARGVDLATVGEPEILDAQDGEAEVLRFADPVGGRYATLALRRDRVVGGAMIGLPDAAASMIQFFDTGIPAPADRLGLLFGRALPGASETTDPGRLPASAVVCRCNTVTKGALVAAWRGGATDVAALSRATRAGTGCGSCGDAVRGICAWLAESDPPVLTPVPEEGAA